MLFVLTFFHLFLKEWEELGRTLALEEELESKRLLSAEERRKDWANLLESPIPLKELRMAIKSGNLLSRHFVNWQMIVTARLVAQQSPNSPVSIDVVLDILELLLQVPLEEMDLSLTQVLELKKSLFLLNSRVPGAKLELKSQKE